MYEFVFASDSWGMPTILTEEHRFVDGALETVVEHAIVSESMQRRSEFTGAVESTVRQLDFAYDTANELNHRLASISSRATDGGKPFTTTFTHDVNNADGSMVVTQVDLPDGTTINHEYDSHIGGQAVDFGFRTKSTRSSPNDGSLVTFDVDYEFFYTSGSARLFYQPRIVKQRDGRGAISEVTLDYDNGGQYVDCCTNVQGQDLNRVLSITGPVITTGPLPPRTPQKEFIYDNSGVSPTYLLSQTETKLDSATLKIVAFAHDELQRPVSTTTDPGGLDLVTQSLYCDTAPTQDRITVDADGYWVRTQFDNDGRVVSTKRYLDANAGTVSTPCIDPTGPFYETTNTYDTNGRRVQRLVDNKDQDGNLLTPPTLTTTLSYDRLGRLELQSVDPAPGINSESHFDYNWLGDIEREFDTSGRGTSRTYEGRGLVDTETPLAMGEVPDADLTTTFEYDAMSNLRLTTQLATSANEERTYDDFDRLEHIKRIPDDGGGKTITTTFEYDDANNVTRTVIDEDGTVLSDTTALYDEGGFHYETRQHLVAGVDNDVDPIDPLTTRRFDWAGNVIEERSRGDATVIDRVVTTEYDDAARVERILDSEGGETAFTLRDGRGNVTLQTVKLNATDSAATNMAYDALGRLVLVTEPEDGAGGRADRVRLYDSRGNLLRETVRDAADVPKLTTVFAYDNAGRQIRRAMLADAAAATAATGADVTIDRVTEFEYDADGRLRFRRNYNNNLATPLTTETTYDVLGRTDRVTDPSSSFTDDDYDEDGRLSQLSVFDGVGTRVFTFGYDGHDRVTTQTALGPPDLITAFGWDGLGRRVRTTDPHSITSRIDYDLVGRRTRLVEDESGALERQTDFAYNSLSQLITQTTKNKNSGGAPLDDQVTTCRYDSLGRQTRIVYPDSADQADPDTCTDCVKAVFDLAGRMTQRTDQRGISTAFTYEDRGGLLTRTTGTDLDTFAHDSTGRLTLAGRGTTVGPDPESVSRATREYTDMGDLDFETQTIAGNTTRTVNYDYDQAGNRIQLTYPGTEVLTYTPTVLDQVDTVHLNAAPLVDYDYNGRLLDTRRTLTSDPGGDKVYEYEVGYDDHRRVNSIANRFESSARASQTVVGYRFSHDDNGNPPTQTVTQALPPFLADDRTFTVDRLDRLTDTEHLENGRVESTVFDLVGNRESHTNRAGTITNYGTVNAANEYPAIGGDALTYDESGNLTVDQDGRHYTYDERNRLTQIKASDQIVLANYTYDALGRRIVFEDPVAGVITRYYYDGQSVIEERDGTCPGPTCDARTRYHINGAQFIDERVATFTEPGARTASGTSGMVGEAATGQSSLGSLSRRGTGAFTYYLVNQGFSIAGTGNADGTVIERLDYSSTGDFAGAGAGPPSFFHDADGDFDIDFRDFAGLQACFGKTDPACLSIHDFDMDGMSNGAIDLDDFVGFNVCTRGPFVTPDQDCAIPNRGGAPPPSGTFTLHGRPVDILSDDHALLDFRARHYDPVIGRWLQRDPLPYNDGSNLYEPFRLNPLRFSDPYGRQADEPGALDSFVEFLRRFRAGADPFTGEDLADRTLRRAGAIDEPNPALRAFYEQADAYEDAAIATIRDAEPVLARGVGVVQVAGGLAETGTGVVLVIYSEGLSGRRSIVSVRMCEPSLRANPAGMA